MRERAPSSPLPAPSHGSGVPIRCESRNSPRRRSASLPGCPARSLRSRESGIIDPAQPPAGVDVGLLIATGIEDCRPTMQPKIRRPLREKRMFRIGRQGGCVVLHGAGDRSLQCRQRSRLGRKEGAALAPAPGGSVGGIVLEVHLVQHGLAEGLVEFFDSSIPGRRGQPGNANQSFEIDQSPGFRRIATLHGHDRGQGQGKGITGPARKLFACESLSAGKIAAAHQNLRQVAHDLRLPRHRLPGSAQQRFGCLVVTPFGEETPEVVQVGRVLPGICDDTVQKATRRPTFAPRVQACLILDEPIKKLLGVDPAPCGFELSDQLDDGLELRLACRRAPSPLSIASAHLDKDRQLS